MKVALVARPQFIGLPEELGAPRKDQLKGPDAQKIIETAGRTCYDSFGQGRNSHEYAKHIMEVGHGSVLEHAQYTFFITGVSRGLSHELVRHRIGVAISQRSTRYVDEAGSPWILHPLLMRALDGIEEARDSDKAPILAMRIQHAMDAGRDAYMEIVEVLQEGLIKGGVDKLTARKQARGAARGLLGNALETELIWSANVRTLRTMLEQRANPAADAEIRAMAHAICMIMKEELPVYFDDYEDIECPDGLPGGLKSKHGRI